jgi:hypothetical protein
MLVTAAHLREHPFSRSYGVNLPSSLTIVISNTLVSSTHLPVSVCGTVSITISLEGFLDDSHPYFASPEGSTCSASPITLADLPTSQGDAFTHTTNSCARDLSHVTPSLTILVTEYQPCVHRLRPSASA